MHIHKKAFNRIMLLILFILLTFGKQLYFQSGSLIGYSNVFSIKNIFTLLSIFAMSVLAAVPFSWMRSTGILRVSLILGAFISMLLFSDLLYYRYYSNVLTIPLLKQIGVVDSVGDSVLYLAKLKDCLLFIDIPIYALLLIFNKRTAPIHAHALKKLAVSLGFACFGAIIFMISILNTSTYSFQFDNTYVINRMGIIYFHTTNVSKYLSDNILKNKNVTDTEKAEVNEVLAGKKSKENEYTGICRNKNVIIVQMESMQEFIIDLKIDGMEITPNLNKFKNESVYLENTYYQTGAGNTSDAEFLANTSLYPADEGSAYFRFSTNKYHALGNILGGMGYSTYSFHANHPTFWNRMEMHKSIGFDTFFDSKSFFLDNVKGWGLVDQSFYRQSLEKINCDSPFYAFLITLTCHYPYKFFECDNYGVPKIGDELMDNYLKGAHYTDAAFGLFIKDITERGLLENSIIMVYGDHQAIPQTKVGSLETLLGHKIGEYELLSLQKVPAIIYAKELSPKTVSKVTGQIDFLPTILNLMGIDQNTCLGKDIFGPDKGYAVLRNGSVITSDFTYISSTKNIYGRNGELIDASDHIAEIVKIHEDLAVSDIILEKDYFRTLD